MMPNSNVHAFEDASVSAILVYQVEASGVIDLDPEGVLEPGTQVVTMMGGMGRVFDGGYAQYVVVPRTQIITFHSSLPWEVIGSVPETLQTQ